MDDSVGFEVPSYFLCPISMDIMKDPVTLPTGITYDRPSIERWLFSDNNPTCPITKLPVSDLDDLTPNHTLRRLIQSWCTLNACYGVERIPTPKAPVSKSEITRIIDGAGCSPETYSACLQRLRSFAASNATNRRCMAAAGAADFLVRCMIDDGPCSHEALAVLHQLQLSDSSLRGLAKKFGPMLVDSLVRIMQIGTYESQAYGLMLLKSIFEVVDPILISSLKKEFFADIVQILNSRTPAKTVKIALKLMVQACPLGRNRFRAIETGAVQALIEILLECPERRTCEMAMTMLEVLCQCAEGRAELLNHRGGIAVVSKRILRVSPLVSDKAVRILLSIAQNMPSTSVVHEMMETGAVMKLCLVLQVDGSSKTKEKAREILKLHAKSWRKSVCVPHYLISSFPL
ncbi:hypothetical protein MLD38_016093 [Melastoma candidum]|uniref:Uncharacterized protein n=1 Tax=Melastoma candidum TaxID=119954 RepID=A0ACB9RIC5_9MYRT|nr:hypothetical protein MLD38_016093 [Melastoma candidum]